MGIDRVKIRAKITIGNLIVETGGSSADIMSFSVTKSRSSGNSFSASVKVESGVIAAPLSGSNIKIEAGENSPSKVVFVGIIKSAKISPCFDDPKYVILGLSGTDVMTFLEGKKYTRRCRGTRSVWYTINNVVRKTLKSGKFERRKAEMFSITAGELPTDANAKVRARQLENIPTAAANEAVIQKKAGVPIKVSYVSGE